jgi:superkiller protein 3
MAEAKATPRVEERAQASPSEPVLERPGDWIDVDTVKRRLKRWDRKVRALLEFLEAGTKEGMTAADWQTQARAWASLGQMSRAADAYDKALACGPKLRRDFRTYREQADALALSGFERYEEAFAAYNRSLELRPDDPDTLNNRGIALGRLERYEEALADFNRSLELRPDDPCTLYNRGTTLGHLKRYEDALPDFNRSLQLSPDHSAVLNNRGITLHHLERYEEALADYNRSLKLHPDHPDAIYNIACLYSLWERYGESLQWLDKAIAGDAKHRPMAREDEDFEGLRNDPQWGPKFWELVGTGDQA